MLRIPLVTMLRMLVVVSLAPTSAFAQVPTVVPSPPWGEPINTPDRFVVLASYNNQAVYDSESGLVWEQSPATTSSFWASAQSACNNKAVGNRKGWRLPTIQELASLIDPTVSPGPTLPPSHPFANVQAEVYWSATTHADVSSEAWVVGFGPGVVVTQSKNLSPYVRTWCVRGGQGVAAQ